MEYAVVITAYSCIQIYSKLESDSSQSIGWRRKLHPTAVVGAYQIMSPAYASRIEPSFLLDGHWKCGGKGLIEAYRLIKAYVVRGS